MAHPLIPQICDLAGPVAANLGLEVVGAKFHTNHSPPVLQLNVRNQADDTSLNDCEAMSRAFEAVLDESELIQEAYVLEVSSPGLSDQLTSDRDFTAFKGFPVVVTTTEPVKGRTAWQGQLIQRDERAIHLSCRGRRVAIPRDAVQEVQLSSE
ncbi:MAG: ribosome maturation factor RimP [Cyanobacteria bacterium P01_A01_bin.135]